MQSNAIKGLGDSRSKPVEFTQEKWLGKQICLRFQHVVARVICIGWSKKEKEEATQSHQSALRPPLFIYLFIYRFLLAQVFFTWT